MQKPKPNSIRAEDWQAVSSPELSNEMLARLRPARGPGRPKADDPKLSVTLRLDSEVVAHFKAKGPGWQTRINAALRRALADDAKGSKR